MKAQDITKTATGWTGGYLASTIAVSGRDLGDGRTKVKTEVMKPLWGSDVVDERLVDSHEKEHAYEVCWDLAESYLDRIDQESAGD